MCVVRTVADLILAMPMAIVTATKRTHGYLQRSTRDLYDEHGNAALQSRMNAIRTTYLALFFANAAFAVLFKSLGEDTLQKFGTFSDCNRRKNASCRGNQMIFRASFSIAVFFLVQTLLCRFYQPKRRCHAFLVLALAEMPVYIGLLVGSFFIPSSFFDGYAHFSRVVSGVFILFQIVSIVDFSYQLRDLLLDRIEESAKEQVGSPSRQSTFLAVFWKVAFLGLCVCALAGAGGGIGYLYHKYGSCDVGVGYTTVTVIFILIFLVICVSAWLNVGLLPPCVVAVYLVLMCWQALESNPHKSCERSYIATKPSESSNAMAYNAIIGAFSMTWTSWRTSSAASTMFSKDAADGNVQAARRKSIKRASVTAKDDFTPAVVSNDDAGKMEKSAVDATAAESNELLPEPWQFYVMMFLAGVYMAMVLTDWDSANGSSNGVSMWVKIVAQWLTMLLFLWTLVAPKLFPDRDFS